MFCISHCKFTVVNYGTSVSRRYILIVLIRILPCSIISCELPSVGLVSFRCLLLPANFDVMCGYSSYGTDMCMLHILVEINITPYLFFLVCEIDVSCGLRSCK